MKITLFNSSPRFQQVGRVSGENTLMSCLIPTKDQLESQTMEEALTQLATYMLQTGIMKELIRLGADDVSGAGVCLLHPIRSKDGEQIHPITTDWAGRGEWVDNYDSDFDIEWCLFVDDSLEGAAVVYSVERLVDRILTKFKIYNTEGIGILPAHQP